MVLKMHLILEVSSAPRMGACKGLSIWMMVKVLPIEVPFQIAITEESL